MKLLVINPNTTQSMTDQIARTAQDAARPGTEIVAVQPRQGPASIQGFHDVARCLSGVLDIAADHADADAVIVACFDDTGVDALRCQFDAPVVGIGEAAAHFASLVSCRFTVVTTLSRAIPNLRNNLQNSGLSAKCGSIRAAEVPVLELESNPGLAESRIAAEIERALREDAAEAIVLGCSGMANLDTRLSERFQIPVIDGVKCAVSLAESLHGVGLRNSKAGGYAAVSHATSTY